MRWLLCFCVFFFWCCCLFCFFFFFFVFLCCLFFVLFVFFCFFCFFFFSSRRRHTRLTCDWSSDVCSSDLGPILMEKLQTHVPKSMQRWIPFMRACTRVVKHWEWAQGLHQVGENQLYINRSEERRVGKECRYRWSTDHSKKKQEKTKKEEED